MPTKRDLTEGLGVVVTDNPTTPQMIVIDTSRILFWNYPDQLTTGKPADGVIQSQFPAPGHTAPDDFLAIKATQHYLYVSVDFRDTHIDIYPLPLTIDSKPIEDLSSLRFPFYTVDGVPLTNGRQRDTTKDEWGPLWGIAPSSDDSYLWISDQQSNRVFRVNNPVPPTPTGSTPTPSHTFTSTPTGTRPTATNTPSFTPSPLGTRPLPTARVDIILGQPDADSFECNRQRASWEPTRVVGVTVTPGTNSIEKPTGAPIGWNAGAGSNQLLSQGLDQSFVSGYIEVTADQTDKDRAFGFSHAQTSSGLNDIDYGFVVNGTPALRVYEAGTPVGEGTFTPVAYGPGDKLRIQVQRDPNGTPVVAYYRFPFLPTATPTPTPTGNTSTPTPLGSFTPVFTPTPTPVYISLTPPSFPLRFNASIYSGGGRITNPYFVGSLRDAMGDDTLCRPGSVTIDRKGNLWVSDYSLESQGNRRLLEYDADQFLTPTPTPTSTGPTHTPTATPAGATYTPTPAVRLAIPAKRVYPNIAGWQPAFDRQNRMVIGYDGQDAAGAPPLPTPPTPAPTWWRTDLGDRFPGLYTHPLYPLPGTAPTPDGRLEDFYSSAYGATFDKYDNLYMRDLNRSRVLIYHQPGYGTPVVWTNLVKVAPTPDLTSNSIVKTTGTPDTWDAGASSVQSFQSSNGFVQITVGQEDGEIGYDRAFGLRRATTTPTPGLGEIAYGFALLNSNDLYVYENGVAVGTPTSYARDDILKVAVENGYVKYYKNGDLMYANPTAVATPYSLSLYATIRTNGGRISNAFISGANSTPTATPTPTTPPTNTPTPANTCTASGWCTKTSPNLGTGANVLNAVAVIASDKIWAVGGHYDGAQGWKSLTEKWNGFDWIIEPVDSRYDVGMLHGVSAVNDHDIWAVGDTDILHYNGTSWSKRPDTKVSGGGGNGIGAPSANSVWAVSSVIQRTIAGGNEWSIFTIPHGGAHTAFSRLNGLAAVAAVNSTDVWAVGYREDDTGNRRPLIVDTSCPNDDACSWSEMPNVTLNGAWLNSISKPDPQQNMWAVGSRYDPGTNRYVALIEFWEATASPTPQWKSVDLSSCSDCNPGDKTNELHSVWFSSEGDVWAAGEYHSADNPPGSGNLMLHWSGSAWSRASVPNPGVADSNRLLGVGTVPGPPGVAVGVWAVGSYIPYQGAPSQTLVEKLGPVTSPPTPPPTSYFETSIDLMAHYDQGCSAAQRRESGVIMLNYGEPKHWTTIEWLQTIHHYGTSLPGTHDLVELDSEENEVNILSAASNFAAGYHNCLDPEQDPLYITLVPSITNDNYDSTAALTEAHAEKWAKMVDALAYFVEENGMSSEIGVAAGISAHPDWSSYQAANDWAEGFRNYSYLPLYNFGGTDGYPAVADGEPDPEIPPPWSYSAWSTEELYNISSGIEDTHAFPQIFQPQWARNWYAVKKWSLESAPEAMQFEGVMSACGSSPCAYGEGLGEYFTAEQAQQVFWQELNQDPDETVHQDWEDSTDVSCSNGVPSGSCEP